ncbi:MAG: DEAD/DEAH box helicase [Candidatus Lokiarchaeota archaeon]|nr:DEAD/DEAH box helicase [Candidatus Lokiarchaeota archaeon]
MINNTIRMTGTIKWFDDKKGFGFIKPDESSEDVFLHRSALHSDENRDMYSGDRITFLVQEREKGPAAQDVKLIKNEIKLPQFKTKTKQNKRESIKSDKKFVDLGLTSELLHAVRDEGYEEPTPIQAQAIPYILKGRDLLGCAQTGTGKTAAFALPTLQSIAKQKDKQHHIRILIVAPTRELAIQINNSFNNYGRYTGLRTTVIYGGVGQNPQVKQLRKGVDIVVATPGRLLDLMRQGYVKLGHVKVLILDEGDRMLDMGFIHDIRKIIKQTPKKGRQTLLFSATIPKGVKKLAKSILTNPVEINISPEKPTLDIIKQYVFLISKNKKQALLQELLADKKVSKALVFTRTKRKANRVVKRLQKRGVRAQPIHGNKSQNARQRALKKFRTGKIRVLVATDVASRGLDVEDISHVIQYDLPDVPETYLHRIGRTARAGAGGTALAFCEGSQRQKLKEIENVIQMRVNLIKDPWNAI